MIEELCKANEIKFNKEQSIQALDRHGGNANLVVEEILNL